MYITSKLRTNQHLFLTDNFLIFMQKFIISYDTLKYKREYTIIINAEKIRISAISTTNTEVKIRAT